MLTRVVSSGPSPEARRSSQSTSSCWSRRTFEQAPQQRASSGSAVGRVESRRPGAPAAASPGRAVSALGHLVEEDRAAGGQLQQPLAVLRRAGERAPRMAPNSSDSNSSSPSKAQLTGTNTARPRVPPHGSPGRSAPCRCRTLPRRPPGTGMRPRAVSSPSGPASARSRRRAAPRRAARRRLVRTTTGRRRATSSRVRVELIELRVVRYRPAAGGQGAPAATATTMRSKNSRWRQSSRHRPASRTLRCRCPQHPHFAPRVV